MSSFIALHSISLSTPDGTLLVPEFSVTFGSERTGLVGANGCGKTTLLRLLSDAQEPESGSISRQGTVASLAQAWSDLSQTVACALGVQDELARLARIESGSGNEDDFARADWTLPDRLGEALARAGLPGARTERTLDELSGGQRTRVGLARIYLQSPDLLLLDEPTNNLDAEGRTQVADLINTWPGGIVVASHDRALLDHVDRILEVSPTGATVFGGGWTEYAEERAARRDREAAALDNATSEVKRIERAVQKQRERKARRDKGGRALRARGDQPNVVLGSMAERAEKSGARERKIGARLEEAAEAARALAAAHVTSRADLRIDAEAAKAHGCIAALEAAVVQRGAFRLGPLDMALGAGERVALVGANGAGKTTLLSLVRGDVSPSSGRVTHRGKVAALDQHAANFDPQTSILDNIRRLHPDLTTEEAHALLARYTFRNVAAEKRVGDLSGGERLRAGLAGTFGGREPPALLTLDEPTNHLDLDAVECLQAALADFDGAILTASHDRGFLDALALDRVVRLENGLIVE